MRIQGSRRQPSERSITLSKFRSKSRVESHQNAAFTRSLFYLTSTSSSPHSLRVCYPEGCDHLESAASGREETAAAELLITTGDDLRARPDVHLSGVVVAAAHPDRSVLHRRQLRQTTTGGGSSVKAALTVREVTSHISIDIRRLTGESTLKQNKKQYYR